MLFKVCVCLKTEVLKLLTEIVAPEIASTFELNSNTESELFPINCLRHLLLHISKP